MQLEEIELPEVKAMHQHARFYNEGNQTYIEISFTGSKQTVKHKVKPVHMAQFKEEWDAFCDGRPPNKRAGTPLIDVIDERLTEDLTNKNIHNLEELAALNDSQCQALGHGTLTSREKARKLLEDRSMKQTEKRLHIISEQQARVGNTQTESAKDIQEIKTSIGDLTQGINVLVSLLSQQNQPKKRGPKPKQPQD